MSRLKGMPKMTILSLARAALKIVRCRKFSIPPTLLFPEGVNMKLRLSDYPFLFLMFVKKPYNEGVESISTKTDTYLLVFCLEHPFDC